jgi:hypothetical protein
VITDTQKELIKKIVDDAFNYLVDEDDEENYTLDWNYGAQGEDLAVILPEIVKSLEFMFWIGMDCKPITDCEVVGILSRPSYTLSKFNKEVVYFYLGEK